MISITSNRVLRFRWEGEDFRWEEIKAKGGGVKEKNEPSMVSRRKTLITIECSPAKKARKKVYCSVFKSIIQIYENGGLEAGLELYAVSVVEDILQKTAGSELPTVSTKATVTHCLDRCFPTCLPPST